MPFVDYPHKEEAGYVTARRCHAAGGGWFVLYDRAHGGLPTITAPVEDTGRFILVVRKSTVQAPVKWTGFDFRKPAMAALKEAAAGNDEYGLVPVATAECLTKPDAPMEAPSEAASPTLASDSESRARDEVPPVVSDGLAIQRALNEAFDPARIVEEFEAGLKATKSYVIGKGDEATVETVDDHATRVKYLALLVGFRIGQPDKREKVMEPKRVSAAELTTMIHRSPAARRRLLAQIQEAEAAAKVGIEAKGREALSL